MTEQETLMMTEREALEGCIKMWEMIKEYNHRLYDSIEALKNTVAVSMGVDWFADCAVCEYDCQSGGGCADCLIKPLVWPYGCCHSGPYAELILETGRYISFKDIPPKEFKAYCQEIIDACYEVLG